MMFFLSRGYRVIAHDRRGHGRSTQTVNGNEMDTYAADVAELVEKLDLRDAIHIGHSTGGGEVARYVARHGKGRVAARYLSAQFARSWSSPPKIRVDRQSRSSTKFARALPTIERSFTKTSRFRSTAITVRERRFLKASETTGGGRG